jgi:transcriptional regulator with XRE-family HTH domain
MEELRLFGNYLKELIYKKNMTLRELSRKSGIDASNLSKIERGVIYPPQKIETLQKLSKALDLEKSEHDKLIDLAALVNGMLPEGMITIKSNEAIPLLLRAIDDRQLTKEETEKIAEMIAKENNFQGKIID